jgi:hypothetical protein
MDTYESTKYNTNKANLKKTLEKYGVAVIPNVFDESESKAILDKMWLFFEQITKKFEIPIQRHDPSTWRSFFSLYPLHAMLIQRYGIGHAQFAWEARQNLKSVEIFAELWNCQPEDLLVSFDGSSFHLPPETTNRGWNRNNTWYHTDQSFTRNDFECAQSFVTLNDINVGDGTLAFMEGSNNLHSDVAIKFKLQDKADWYKLSKEQEEYYLSQGCEYKKISCPKGSMVFWDSRTIHCGIEPFKQRQQPNLRSVIYLCYMPRSLISNANLKKKKEAFNNLRTTNHWPCKPKLFSVNPRTYGNEMQEINPIEKPIVNQLGLKLAGF